jgi:hypothetical protein
VGADQGCQIFLGSTNQNWENIPNDLKMDQMAVKYGGKIDRMATNTTSSIARPSKMYPNWDFWFENIQATLGQIRNATLHVTIFTDPPP